MMRTFDLSDVQAEASLNMRLLAWRRLEEIEIRKEYEELSAERDDLTALLDDERRRWRTGGGQLGELRRTFGKDTELGRRRPEVGAAPRAVVVQNGRASCRDRVCEYV